MHIKKCAICRTVFQANDEKARAICSDCAFEEDKIIQNLQQYILNNPNCTMEDAAKAAKTSPERIKSFVRARRLRVSEGMLGAVHCVTCGKSIFRGRYCMDCLTKLNNGLRSAAKK